MAGAVRTDDREEPVSSDASLSVTSMREARRSRARRAAAASSGPALSTFIGSFADSWLAAGGSADDLMHITGWKTYDMVREYSEARGIACAHNAHARLSPGDRI
jgi:hypothetical protein